MKCPELADLPPPPPERTGWPWTEGTAGAGWIEKRTHWPRVSLVMPAFNQGAFIEEAIRSALLQGYPDLEFFVYDAASGDGTADVVRRYAPWLTFWVSEKDRGQSAAINKGLARSTGRFFNWHNSDDVLTPSSLFKAVNALLEHPEASHVHGYVRVIYANGETHSCTESAIGPPTRLFPPVGDSIANLKTGAQPGGLMDKTLVERVGGVDESMHFAMDMDILLKLSVIKPALYAHEELVHYRFHPDTKSHAAWPRERRFEKLRLVESLFRMPEAAAFRSRRKEAQATAHRYAADCSWMSRDLPAFCYHILMDVFWAPLKGLEKRRALFHFLRERKRAERHMRALQGKQPGIGGAHGNED